MTVTGVWGGVGGGDVLDLAFPWGRGGSHIWDKALGPMMGLTLTVWDLGFILTSCLMHRELFRINWVIVQKF